MTIRCPWAVSIALLALLLLGGASAPRIAQAAPPQAPDLCAALPPGGAEVTPGEMHDDELNWMSLYAGVNPVQAVLSSVAIKCGEMMSAQSAQPLAMAASGDVASLLPAMPAAAPTSPAALALPAGIPAWLVLGACMVLLALVVVVVGVVFMGKRRRPVAPVPPVPQMPQGYASPAPFARLVVSQGSASYPWLDLPPAGVVVGRNHDCGLMLADQLASRYHARIEPAPGGRWFITDLNSSNGTLVNGMRVSSQPLNPNDQIQIGTTVLTFQQW
jgi:hypothetical protein